MKRFLTSQLDSGLKHCVIAIFILDMRVIIINEDKLSIILNLINRYAYANLFYNAELFI
jgi:hypothetical protein